MTAPNTTPGPWAFPIAVPGDHYHVDQGMALRDWFAGQLAPICFAQDHGNDWGKSGVEHASRSARRAYAWADAMLAERARGEVAK